MREVVHSGKSHLLGQFVKKKEVAHHIDKHQQINVIPYLRHSIPFTPFHPDNGINVTGGMRMKCSIYINFFDANIKST